MMKMRRSALVSLPLLALGLPAAGQALVLEAVDVRAVRPAGQPGNQSLLTRKDIEAVKADHPAGLLNTLAGVKIEENSGQESLIAIRSPVLTGGAGQGSFLVLLNGVPTRASAFGNVNMLMELHHELADAVEVVRGPGGARYGSNAVHGLVNVLLPGGETWEGREITVSASTLSRYRLDGEVSGGGGWLGVSVQHDLGWRQSSGLDQFKLSGVRSFTAGVWDGEAFVSTAFLDQDTAGFITGARAYEDEDIARSNPNPDAYRQAGWGMAAVRLERRLAGGLDLTLTPYVRGQAMEFSQHFLPYDGTEENDHVSFGVLATVAGQAGSLRWRAGLDVDGARGGLTETQARPSFGAFPQGVHYDYTVRAATAAMWGEADWQVSPRWRLSAGLRAERQRQDYETAAPPGISGRFLVVPDRSDSFAFVSPKLGVTGDYGPVTVYASYARGNRAPQASDLYRLQSLQVAPAAGVETLDQVEAGVRGRLGLDVSFDVTAYAMKKRGFFFRDADGLNVTDGRTEHYGLEAAAAWSLTEALTLSGSAAWSRQTYDFTRIVSRGEESIVAGGQIDTAPEWLADAALGWQVSPRFSLRLSAEYVGEHFTDAGNTATYPGHTVLNLRAGYDVGAGLEVFAVAGNLTDARYASRADFAFGTDRYFPGEPMSLTVGVRKRFERGG